MQSAQLLWILNGVWRDQVKLVSPQAPWYVVKVKASEQLVACVAVLRDASGGAWTSLSQMRELAKRAEVFRITAWKIAMEGLHATSGA